MIRARLAPAARRDLVEASRWIAKDNPAAAGALRAGVAKAALILAEHPYNGSLRPAVADIPFRFLPLTGFPYLVVYDPDARPPLIVRVLHDARELPAVLHDL
jgi:toxin ParE1/3/4